MGLWELMTHIWIMVNKAYRNYCSSRSGTVSTFSIDGLVQFAPCSDTCLDVQAYVVQSVVFHAAEHVHEVLVQQPANRTSVSRRWQKLLQLGDLLVRWTA